MKIIFKKAKNYPLQDTLFNLEMCFKVLETKHFEWGKFTSPVKNNLKWITKKLNELV